MADLRTEVENGRLIKTTHFLVERTGLPPHSSFNIGHFQFEAFD